MFRLILCEKPSVAQNIAYSLGANERISDGKVSYYQGNGYIVTNAVGHIVGIGMPEDYGWDKWELSSLPMMPDFRLFPLYGYGEQLRLLKKLLFRDDVSEVINACDAGREGEAIFRYIYDYLGCKKPVKRLWISSMTDESIRQGMNTLRDGADMEKLFAAAFTRAKASLEVRLSPMFRSLRSTSRPLRGSMLPMAKSMRSRTGSFLILRTRIPPSRQKYSV